MKTTHSNISKFLNTGAAHVTETVSSEILDRIATAAATRIGRPIPEIRWFSKSETEAGILGTIEHTDDEEARYCIGHTIYANLETGRMKLTTDYAKAEIASLEKAYA